MRVRFSRELAGAAPAMIIPSSFAGKENLGNLAAFPRPRITSDRKSPHNDGLGIILELPSKNFGVDLCGSRQWLRGVFLRFNIKPRVLDKRRILQFLGENGMLSGVQ
jgi:hypothetical protein